MAALQFTTELVTTTVVIIGLVGTGFGYLIYIAHRAFNKLVTADSDTRTKQEEQSHQITRQLCDQYREMYNLEKEKCERSLADLSNQIEHLRQELNYLRGRLAETTTEIESLRALNLKLQQKGE